MEQAWNEDRDQGWAAFKLFKKLNNMKEKLKKCGQNRNLGTYKVSWGSGSRTA